MGQTQQVLQNQPNQLNLMANGYKFIDTIQTYNLNGNLKFYKKINQYMCINKISLEINTTLMEINQYYSVRQKIKANPYLLTIHKMDMIDQIKKQSILNFLQQNGTKPLQDSNKTNVNTICSLNMFEKYCHAAFVNSKKSNEQFNFTLSLHQEYLSSTLQQQILLRHNRLQHYHQRQIWIILANGISAAHTLITNGLKQPILSPNAIKINHKKHIKVGQWQISHFFNKQQQQNDNHFLEEGQTLVKIDSSKVTPIKKQYQYNILKSYYWAPEGTSGMQSAIGLGKLTKQYKNTYDSQSQYPKSQIFSFGMTILHMCLLRPLYQKQTFSQKRIKSYLNQAIQYRKSQGFALSGPLIEILGKMLKWDPQQRIGYPQLSQQIEDSRESPVIHTFKAVHTVSLNNPMEKTSIKCSKSYQNFKYNNNEGSGYIDQGYGDDYFPEEQYKNIGDKRQIQQFTSRNRETDSSVIDYEKIDYTIRRQRNQWKKFNERIVNQSAYKVKKDNISKILDFNEPKIDNIYPIVPLCYDKQDQENKQALCQLGVNKQQEYEVTDSDGFSGHQTQKYQQSVGSIKLLDISNIKVKEKQSPNNSKYFSHSSIHINQENSIFRLNQTDEYQQKPSVIQKNKFNNEISFHSQSDSNLLKSKSYTSKIAAFQPQIVPQQKHLTLFTSPQLMALIRTPVCSKESRVSEKKTKKVNIKSIQNQVKLQSNQIILDQNTADLSRQTYIKQTFNKGYYEGGKHNGLRSGYGTFYYNKGGKYCGDWVNNKMHGKGTLFYPDGRIAYQGQWRNDSLCGKGIKYNENPQRLKKQFDYKSFKQSQLYWVSYQGTFHNDDKWGQGTLCLSNGQKYEGQFKNDLVDGRGIFYSLSGIKIKGQWKQNKLIRLINESKYQRQSASIQQQLQLYQSK